MSDLKEISVNLTFTLDEEDQAKLAEFVALRREYDAACDPGRTYPERRYTDEATLAHIIGVAFSGAMLDEAIRREEDILRHRKEVGPVRPASHGKEAAP